MSASFAILYAPGINCHEETTFAVEHVGGRGRVVALRSLIEGRDSLKTFDGIVIPGGFSWGDHLGAGRIFAVHMVARLADELLAFVAAGKPILGICNGNQILVETGLLPSLDLGNRGVALLQNRSARFESRMSTIVCDKGARETYWTRGLGDMPLRIPVAHGEGRVYCDEGVRVTPAFLYVGDNGLPTESYPANPAGSPGGVAGIIDSTGMVLGMMPHPERAIMPWHDSQDGLAIMRHLIPE